MEVFAPPESDSSAAEIPVLLPPSITELDVSLPWGTGSWWEWPAETPARAIPWLEQIKLSDSSQLRVWRAPTHWDQPLPFELPDTLTELQLPNNFTHCPSKWPTHLRKLLCVTSYISLNDWPPLSLTLTEFDTSEGYPTGALDGLLPDSITSIRWHDFPHPIEPHWRFPSSLTSLTLFGWNPPEGSGRSLQLPASLKELDIHSHRYVYELTLPDSITSLCISYTNIAKWPAQLHSLTFRSQVSDPDAFCMDSTISTHTLTVGRGVE